MRRSQEEKTFDECVDKLVDDGRVIIHGADIKLVDKVKETARKRSGKEVHVSIKGSWANMRLIDN